MTRARLGTILIAAAFALSACGSSASTPAPAASGAPGATKAPSTEVAATQTSGSEPTVVVPAGGSGSCTVSITGDVTKSWTTKQDMGTLLLSQWLSASSRDMMSVNAGEDAMILNCKGTDDMSVDFTTPAGTTSAMFPMGPKTYTIAEGGLLGSDMPGEIGVLINLHDNLIWAAAEAGTFDVTTFGDGKFAGTFSVKIKATADLQTRAANAVLTGSFDLSCTGDACS